MKCEKCNIEHDGTFGSGRFCNRSCANSKVFTEESKKKKSIAGKEYYSTHQHIMKGITGYYKHTDEIKKLLSKYGKEKWKNGIIFKIPGNAYPRKLELKYKMAIEKWFHTVDLNPKKIDKHWFDFVNHDFVIEFTTDATAGIFEAIKRFESIINDKRRKFLVCPGNYFGKKRKERLYSTGAKFVDINLLTMV